MWSKVAIILDSNHSRVTLRNMAHTLCRFWVASASDYTSIVDQRVPMTIDKTADVDAILTIIGQGHHEVAAEVRVVPTVIHLEPIS